MKTWAILCGVSLSTWVSTASAQVDVAPRAPKLDARALAAKLPTFDTDKTDCPPFDAELRIHLAEGDYVVHTRFRKPDRIVVLMRDCADASPVFLYRDNTAMYFEPEMPEFVCLPGHDLEFLLAPSPAGKLNIQARVGFGGDVPRRLCFDYAGILRLPAGQLRDLGSTGQVIRLARQVEPGRRDEVVFRPNSDPPTCTLSTWFVARPQPAIELTVSINRSDSESLFEIPDLPDVRRVIAVPESIEDPSSAEGVATLEDKVALLKSVHDCLFRHLATRNPESREKPLFPGSIPIDWKSVARNKREFGPKLRDVLGLGPLTMRENEDDRPVSPDLASESAPVIR